MNKIVGRECRNIVHIPKKISGVDVHIVKEITHYEDGTVEPNLRVIKNFERPFWVTKKVFRDHEQKKESESLDKLEKFTATQSDLPKEIAKVLNVKRYNPTMRDVSESPYLYGTDISSIPILRKMYQDKYPEFNTDWTVSTLDIENDVDSGLITIITVAMKDKVYTVIDKEYLANVEKIYKTKDPISKLKELNNDFIPKTNQKGEILVTASAKKEIVILDGELSLIKSIFEKLHSWQPDVVAIWNIDYDLPKIEKTLKKYEVNPASVFCDPRLNDNFKYYRYKEGQRQMTTESGVLKSKAPHEQWHYAYCASSFLFLDAMSTYNYIRVGGKQIHGGFGLDNVLNKELKLNKLTFDDVKIKGADWHRMMTKDMPLEYVVYNIWDSLSMVELDLKTSDLSQVAPLFAGVSDLDIFNSGPKRIIDALYFFYLDRGRVIGSKPAKVSKDKILGLDKWINTLPASRMVNNGLKVIKGDNHTVSNIRSHVGDSDMVSAYPRVTVAGNVSKETTVREIIKIEGKEKEDFKSQNINLVFGQVNAVGYSTEMFNFPVLKNLLLD